MKLPDKHQYKEIKNGGHLLFQSELTVLIAFGALLVSLILNAMSHLKLY